MSLRHFWQFAPIIFGSTVVTLTILSSSFTYPQNNNKRLLLLFSDDHAEEMEIWDRVDRHWKTKFQTTKGSGTGESIWILRCGLSNYLSIASTSSALSACVCRKSEQIETEYFIKCLLPNFQLVGFLAFNIKAHTLVYVAKRKQKTSESPTCLFSVVLSSYIDWVNWWVFTIPMVYMQDLNSIAHPLWCFDTKTSSSNLFYAEPSRRI